MHFEQAWISMSEGSTGTRMASALVTSCGMSWAGTAAGVSATSQSQPTGARSRNERVTRRLRSKAAMPWICGSSGPRFFSQRVLDACGS